MFYETHEKRPESHRRHGDSDNCTKDVKRHTDKLFFENGFAGFSPKHSKQKTKSTIHSSLQILCTFFHVVYSMMICDKYRSFIDGKISIREVKCVCSRDNLKVKNFWYKITYL